MISAHKRRLHATVRYPSHRQALALGAVKAHIHFYRTAALQSYGQHIRICGPPLWQGYRNLPYVDAQPYRTRSQVQDRDIGKYSRRPRALRLI